MPAALEATVQPKPDAYTWGPLSILAAYRLLIVTVITVAFFGTRGTTFMQTAEPGLFQTVLLIYLGFSTGAYLLVRLLRRGFLFQVYGQLGLDVIAITHLILASGTLGNGLGALMVVAIAGLSMLVRRRTAALFASLASLLLLATQILTHLQTGAPGVDYSQVGFLGITIFITALLSSLLADRARRNQELADRRGSDLESMEALNEHIVQAMQSGVIAVGADGWIRLMNGAAWNLLGQPERRRDVQLVTTAPALTRALRQWQSKKSMDSASFSVAGHEITARFRPLGAGGALIFIDDAAHLRAQVQQAKLATLGRLTANIAHEIRNPLGAISHAAQLLEESDSLSDSDRRLLTIIRKQGGRLNRVVENVLQLSRRQAPNRMQIALRPWLNDFLRDFREQYPQQSYRIEAHVQPGDLSIEFDPDHLHQVLTNLCRNALQHGRADDTWIMIRGYLRPSGRPQLEVRDNGSGIDREAAQKLFEPFFTTSNTGTGLGLYLCRELCEANHAHLAPAPAAASALVADGPEDEAPTGACFQISLPARKEN
jgi:two-component system sensor histidine kinase PilS (NtrC family)